jgi:hypothetical protein
VAAGCICSQARNKFGKGVAKGDSVRWYPNFMCKMHGRAVLKPGEIAKKSTLAKLAAGAVSKSNGRKRTVRKRASAQ